MLYQLSYSHRFSSIIATGVRAVRGAGRVVQTSEISLVPADADILESHGAQAG